MASLSYGSSKGLGKGRSSGAGGRLCAALCLLSVVLFTLSVRGFAPLEAIRSAVSLVTQPVRTVGSVVLSPLSGAGDVLHNLTADEATLTQLEEENEQLRATVAQLEESQLTAERLQDLLDLKSTYRLQSTAARVISGSSDSWTSTVTIDKGTSAGLAQGMPVTDSSGVIGQISQCGLSSSVVRLISDEGSSVSAMVQSSRAQGMLRGSADGTLRLALVRTDQEVNVGDLVITSGLGGVFPKGLLLGTVENVERSSGSLYYDITVRAPSSPGLQEEVLVITALSEDQQATAEEIDSAEKLNEGADAASGTASTDDSGDGTDDAAAEGEADGGGDE